MTAKLCLYPLRSTIYYKRAGFELDHTGHQQQVSPAVTSVACEVQLYDSLLSRQLRHFFTSMCNHKINFWPFRNDTGWID
ncbi:MAG: hypothetical protein ACI9YO_003336 [Gammaproteobacteria bacterium]|jgi:hypothetical protein